MLMDFNAAKINLEQINDRSPLRSGQPCKSDKLWNQLPKTELGEEKNLKRNM